MLYFLVMEKSWRIHVGKEEDPCTLEDLGDNALFKSVHLHYITQPVATEALKKWDGERILMSRGIGRGLACMLPLESL